MGSRRSLASEPRGSPPARRQSRPQQPSSPSNSVVAETSYPPYKNQHNNLPRRESSALEKLLGRDSDQYVKQHMDNYDRMVDRWSDCPMAEWIAGADGLLLRVLIINDTLGNSFPRRFRNRIQVSQNA